MASKIKAGPAGTFAVFGTLLTRLLLPLYILVKFGSTGNGQHGLIHTILQHIQKERN